MKQHQKWLNETLSREEAKKFESETMDINTIGEAILVLSETSWQGALEWVLNMFGANTFHGFPPIDVEKAIKEELEDGK